MYYKYFRLILISFILIYTSFNSQNMFARSETFPDNPKFVFDLTITQSKSQDNAIILKWYPQNRHVAGYKIQYAQKGSDIYNEIDVGQLTEYVLDGLEKNVEYEFKIIGYDINSQKVTTSVAEKFSLQPKRMAKLSRDLTDITFQPSVELKIVALDVNFPDIYSTVQLDTSNMEGAVFTSDNFQAFEDGRLQEELFDVTFPDSFEWVRLVDFVFLIDNSGSMEPEHLEVWQNVGKFVDSLKARGINFRLGLVRFGQAQNWGRPILVNNGNLIDNVDTFKDWINNMTTDGGFEPGIEAVYRAATQFNFRKGAYKHFLLITDEDSDSGNLNDAIVACKKNYITVHCAVDQSYGTSYEDYADPTTSIRSTGGLLFPVLGPYDQILDELQRLIGNTYIVRYRTDNPIPDGKRREVIIKFSYFEHTSQDTAYYIAGGAPKIERTPETKALSDSSLIEGTKIPISAYITDKAAPFVHTASLFYRHIDEDDYHSTPMINLSDSLYQAEIPDSVVKTPGIQYYITAADSYITSSDPITDPALYSYNIAIYPNYPPRIVHTPIKAAPVGVAIKVSCEATDSTYSLASVKLHYKKTGTLIYATADMDSMGESIFSAYIPSSFVTIDGVDYTISATDDLGIRSTHGPHHIDVFPPTDGYHIVSDGTWKTYTEFISGWETIDFNDSGWNRAYVLDEDDFERGYPNQPTDYLRGTTKSGVNDYRFIWDSSGLCTDEVWFRKTFNLVACPKVNAAILNLGINDDYHELYLNGILLGQDTDRRPTQFDQYDVTPYLKGEKNVIAIHVKYCGGFPDPHHSAQVDPNKWLLFDLAINPQAPPITLEVEAMSFNSRSGYEYDGGFVIPKEKLASDWVYFPKAQKYRFTIRAKTLGNSTTMNLRLQHAFEGTAKINGATYQGYEFTSFITSAKHRVDILNLESQELVVDWIRIEPVDTIKYEIVHVFEAEGMPIKYRGRAWGFFWILPDKGNYVGTEFTLPAGSYRMMVIVRQKDGQPKMLIHLDDTTIEANTDQPYYSFDFKSLGSDTHTLRIESRVRSLYVDKVIIYAIPPLLAKNIVDIQQQPPLPDKFASTQNYPNPFNPETKIVYQLPKKCLVTLKIYNCLGQRIRTLVDKMQEPGNYEIHWNGQDDFNQDAPSGIYIYIFHAGHYKISKKMIKLK